LREQFAVGIDVADARHEFGIARIRLQQIVFDPDRDGGIGRIEISKGR